MNVVKIKQYDQICQSIQCSGKIEFFLNNKIRVRNPEENVLYNWHFGFWGFRCSWYYSSWLWTYKY
jgi:hypothetical protein